MSTKGQGHSLTLVQITQIHYTLGIYAEGIYSYRLRLFVCTSVIFMELLQSFTCKQLELSISHQPLIRKHSYLDHRYPGGSAFIP